MPEDLTAGITAETAPAPRPAGAPLAPEKFHDPAVTAKGEPRAQVMLGDLTTLWFNTGTVCNLACSGCYIESSPAEDRLAPLTAAEISAFLDEIARDGWPVKEIGFTGGEPFINPGIIAMLADALGRGFRVLVLTNGMRPMRRHEAALRDLRARHGERLALRVSLDHYTAELHERERGRRSWQPALDGLLWLVRHGFVPLVATRLMWGEGEAATRAGFARLFAEHGVPLDAEDPAALVAFPEMDARLDVPEITTACWGILGVSPGAMMCATSRMVIRRKGAAGPVVVPCTLLPDGEQFELGATLAEARRSVALNHPHCARFCVLGGASCSRGG